MVIGVLLAGLSAADPPEGLYIAEGVDYVGCFEHGQAHHEQVLNVSISAECSLTRPGSCLTPPSCIDSCRNTSTSYVYIGLKYPGRCFCDSVLRGVTVQTDSVGWSNCDAKCRTSDGDSQLACGGTHNILVYQCSTNYEGYSGEGDIAIVTTSNNKTDKMPQSNTGMHEGPVKLISVSVYFDFSKAIIAGAAAGGAAVLIVAGSVVGVCIWRRKPGRRQTDKPSSSLALQDVPTAHPPLDTNPTAPPNPSNIDALYAKPDKKRKQKMSSPDDPSYQDVVPTGAQNQYAAVNDDYPPYTMVQLGSNTYDSIQTDPQYAVVKKGPRYRPNVDVNPIYISGTDEANVSSGSTVMVDNAIYE
ncbi:hypothetical protein Bbelb_358490 [Branchiostoma belcheri]|nr:hypothetical protein Bbelb_358490 [Branchiostoma belcheri]